MHSVYDPWPATAGMTDEQPMDDYKIIEEKWKASDSCKELTRALRENMIRPDIEIKTCVCFGTGTVCGYYAWAWTGPPWHHGALYQVAAFKGAIDIIGTAAHRCKSWLTSSRRRSTRHPTGDVCSRAYTTSLLKLYSEHCAFRKSIHPMAGIIHHLCSPPMIQALCSTSSVKISRGIAPCI